MERGHVQALHLHEHVVVRVGGRLSQTASCCLDMRIEGRALPATRLGEKSKAAGGRRAKGCTPTLLGNRLAAEGEEQHCRRRRCQRARHGAVGRGSAALSETLA